MRHRNPRTLLLAVVLALTSVLPVGVATAAHASADGDITWTVRPSDGTGEDDRSWVELRLDPGESVVEYMLVRNLSPQAVTFTLTAADGYLTENGRFDMLTAGQPSRDAGTWIKLPSSVAVASGGEAVVPFTVGVPANASPGDHLAGVAASIRSGGDEVGVESRVGFRVMTRVTGDLAPVLTTAGSAQYVTSWNPFQPGELEITHEVANTGNTRLSVQPRVTVDALFGLVSVNIDGEAIAELAPGDARAATTRIPALWPAGLYAVTVSAEAASVPESEAAVAVSSLSGTAWVAAVPWPQLGALALLLALILLVRLDRRRRRRAIEARIEQARRDGAAASLRSSVVGAGSGMAALVTVLVLAAPAAPPARASTPPPTTTGTVVIQVQVDDAMPSAPLTPAPLPAAGPLPATGLTDPWALGVVAVVTASAGALALAADRRGDDSRRR